jgi:hypothetical protein
VIKPALGANSIDSQVEMIARVLPRWHPLTQYMGRARDKRLKIWDDLVKRKTCICDGTSLRICKAERSPSVPGINEATNRDPTSMPCSDQSVAISMER